MPTTNIYQDLISGHANNKYISDLIERGHANNKYISDLIERGHANNKYISDFSNKQAHVQCSNVH